MKEVKRSEHSWECFSAHPPHNPSPLSDKRTLEKEKK